MSLATTSPFNMPVNFSLLIALMIFKLSWVTFTFNAFSGCCEMAPSIKMDSSSL